MSLEKARELVAAGAAFLDERSDVPANWRTLIDVERFSIDDGRWCVLGQLAPHIDGVEISADGHDEPYSEVYVHLWPEGDDSGLVDGVHAAVRLGFYSPRFLWPVPDGMEGVGGVNLNEAWREALAPVEVTS